MPKNTSIRTAILGFGVSGRVFHAPFIAVDQSFALEYITTSDPERARQARELYPQSAILAKPEDVFAHAEELDLVIICTPPSTHYELAKTAIEHGLNVVIDKPFVPSSAQGQELIEQAAQAGVALTVFQNRRWDGDFLTLKKLVASGGLGDVRSFESRFEWWKPQGFRDWKASASLAEAGGILYDLGTHLIDQAIELFGPVEAVYAETARYSEGSDADEEAFVSLRHVSGTRSRLMMSGMAALSAPRFHVLGSKGAYSKWGLDGQEPALAGGASPTDEDYGLEPESTWGTVGVPGDTRKLPSERGAYGDFYRLLAESLTVGSPLPVDPADSVEVLRIIERAHAVAALRPHQI